MLKAFFNLSKRNNSTSVISTRIDLIKSLIVHKQIKEFCSYLRRHDDQMLCFEGFFQLLPSILDEQYLNELFEIILKKSRLKPMELSNIISNKLSLAILNKNFDLCEKILYLPFQSLSILLSTYELIQLIHHCKDSNQILRCLSKLIERNLPYDNEYLSWILIILFEHYEIGDEILIEHILKFKKSIDLLFICYGNNNVTPLMLFFHLYSNNKCQILLDSYIDNLHSNQILLQCDRWNRSYLMHLLCGRCEHEIDENNTLCPHTSIIISRFLMLDQLGNRLDTPMKTILTSEYCFSLRMNLINNYLDNHSTYEMFLNEFFQYFPSKYISIYENNLKKIVYNQNLNSILISQLQLQRDDYQIIKFLLEQGARINSNNDIQSIIWNHLTNSQSIIPFILLDYSFYINISFDLWIFQHTERINLYICRVLQCGYPSEFRLKFDQFKAHLNTQTVKEIEKIIDIKNVTLLSNLCLQKLRQTLKHLGNETINQLNDYLPIHLRKSIIHYGYEQCQSYFQTTLSIP